MAVDNRRGIWSRRDFFTRLGWGAFGFFSFATLIGFVRSAFPRVLFKPPSTFKAGFPSDYTLGEVSEKYIQEFRVWIIREEQGIYAVFAKCTHLGCTPRWLAAEDKFKCPCHRSGYYKSGMNFEGPAPRPMDRFKVEVGEDGQLVVDKDVLYRMQFDSGLPAVVASTGVSMYLTKDAIVVMLRYFAALAPGSTVAMSFMLPTELVDREVRPAVERAAAGARANGTPFISFFTPTEMLTLARGSGFREVRHVSAATLAQRYFAGRTDGLRPPNNSEELLVATT